MNAFKNTGNRGNKLQIAITVSYTEKLFIAIYVIFYIDNSKKY